MIFIFTSICICVRYYTTFSILCFFMSNDDDANNWHTYKRLAVSMSNSSLLKHLIIFINSEGNIFSICLTNQYSESSLLVFCIQKVKKNKHKIKNICLSECSEYVIVVVLSVRLLWQWLSWQLHKSYKSSCQSTSDINLAWSCWIMFVSLEPITSQCWYDLSLWELK